MKLPRSTQPYVWTREGWLYLAAVEDLYSRKVVGWSLSARLHSRLVVDALEMAIRHRLPGEELLHHSDRGSGHRREALVMPAKTTNGCCKITGSLAA